MVLKIATKEMTTGIPSEVIVKTSKNRKKMFLVTCTDAGLQRIMDSEQLSYSSLDFLDGLISN
jgi:hypothetical protein